MDPKEALAVVKQLYNPQVSRFTVPEHRTIQEAFKTLDEFINIEKTNGKTKQLNKIKNN